MGGERRKITVYLHPEDAFADKAALDVLESMPQRVRGDFYRNALISAVALSQVDSRLPAMIAMLFDGDFNAKRLTETIEMITGNNINQSDENDPSFSDISDVDKEKNRIRNKAKNLF